MSASAHGCWRRIGVYGGDHSCERLQQDIHCRNCAVFRDAARALLARDLEPLPPLSASVRAAEDEDTLSLLAFRLGEQWLGLPCTHVREVAPQRKTRRLAHRSKGRLEGLVSVRGELQLCVSLIEVLELGSREGQTGDAVRLVMVAPPEQAPLAFRSDAVHGTLHLPRRGIGGVPASVPPVLARCLTGIAPSDLGQLAIVDADAIYAVLEEALYR